jgi:hypothetical protein
MEYPFTRLLNFLFIYLRLPRRGHEGVTVAARLRFRGGWSRLSVAVSSVSECLSR